MSIWKALILYLRSNTSLILSSLYLFSAVTAGIITGRGMLPILLTLLYISVTAMVFVSRRGAREIVQERDEDREREDLEKIREAESTRRRLAVLRIGDEWVRRELEHFVLVSGEILETCRQRKKPVPQVKAEIEDVFSSCSTYLRDLDRLSTSRRYGSEPETENNRLAANAAAFIEARRERLEELRRSELPEAEDFPDPDQGGTDVI